MNQFPIDRCGECPSCKHVKATQEIILAGISQRAGQRSLTEQNGDTEMWNAALADPCTNLPKANE